MSDIKPSFQGEINGYYKGKIKVVGVDLMCFPAHLETLEPLACGCYDPFAWSDQDAEPVETISVGEWNDRRNAQRGQTYNHKAGALK